MRVTLDLGSGRYESRLAEALRRGIKAFGDQIVPSEDARVAVVWGVKSRQKFDAYRERGVDVVVCDKGYVGDRSGWVRTAVNAQGPGKYVMTYERPGTRWRALPWSRVDAADIPCRGSDVLLALSSQKYANWHRLGDAQRYASQLIKNTRTITDRPIVYRPKPSWALKLPEKDLQVFGAELSIGRSLMEDLSSTWCVVTHGSGAAVDALVWGIPAIVLSSESVAAPLCARSICFDNVAYPPWPDHDRRRQWMRNVAYTQWTYDEIASGRAWWHIREDIERAQEEIVEGGVAS